MANSRFAHRARRNCRSRGDRVIGRRNPNRSRWKGHLLLRPTQRVASSAIAHGRAVRAGRRRVAQYGQGSLAPCTYGVARMGFRAARGTEAAGTTSLVTVRRLAAELPELLAGIVGEVEPVIAVLVDVEQGDPARSVPIAKEEGVLGDAGGAEEGLEADAAWGERARHVIRSVTAGRQDRRRRA